jgi:hypothetical protein
VDQLGYALNFVSGSLQVDQKPLTITANDMTKGYGSLDMLTFGYSALASGDIIGNVLGGSLTRAPGESIGGPYAVTQGSLAVTDSNYNTLLTFNPGTLQIVPLVEPWQPTSLFTQTGTTLPPTLPNSMVAQIDSQQARPLTAYASNDGSSGEITQQWGSGNGPAVTILDGGVRMPDDRDDERKDRQ